MACRAGLWIYFHLAGVNTTCSLTLLSVLRVGAWWLLRDRDEWPRGGILRVALRPLINETNTDLPLFAGVILLAKGDTDIFLAALKRPRDKRIHAHF